jgi:hypothetical protein
MNMKKLVLPSMAVIGVLSFHSVSGWAQTQLPKPNPLDETKNTYSVFTNATNGIMFDGSGPDTVGTELIGYLKNAGAVDPSKPVTGGPNSGSGFQPFPDQIFYKFGTIGGFHSDSKMIHPQTSVTLHTLVQSLSHSNYQSGKQEVEVRLDGAISEDLLNLMKAAGVPATPGQGVTFYTGKNMFCFTFPGDGGKAVNSCVIKFDPST